jgi:hypothetical protein
MTVKLACPECGKSDCLSTTERLYGLAFCEVYEDGEIAFEGGTEVLFDTSETIGIVCRCGWQYEGEDWIEQLQKESSD